VNTELIVTIIAITVLVGVVALRSATAGKVVITLNDAIIAAIAVALALLISGKLTKIVVGSEGVTIETTRDAILSSAAQPIAQQVNALPVAPVEQAMKGGIAEIPEMVRQRVQGLDFMLNFGGYDQTILKTYLETLTRYDFFRYIILLNPGSGETFLDFALLLNRASDADKLKLAQLPSFVPSSDAVTKKSDKRDVLDRMEKSGRDWLPVVNAQGQLDGIVDRSRLTASMILDVTNQLKAAQPHR
jgi:hypothetical protein